MKKRICIILSNIDRAVTFEWICERIDKSRFSLEFILLNPGASHLEQYLASRNIPLKVIELKGRGDYPLAFFRLIKHLAASKPDAVNTHLIDASLLGLPAALLTGIQQRILTRHHADFHHRHAPRWVFVDRFLSAMATQIVAVSPTVKDILINRERVPAAKVALVQTGFDLNRFAHPDDHSVRELRHRLGIDGRYPVVGVISRYILWKGHAHIITAFTHLLQSHPNAVLCLANAAGPDVGAIQTMLKSIPPRNLVQIEFERDLFSLYHIFDVFVHVPVSSTAEAFGQVYVEAMAAGIPSIFTKSGIGNDILQDGLNCVIVPYADHDAIYLALNRILSGEINLDLMAARSQESARRFNIDFMITLLEEVYGFPGDR